jgi:hypothetical protein
MKKFEHKTLTVPTKGWMKYKLDFDALEIQLNELGKLGWEVVISMNNVYNGGSYATNVIILKREINH